MMLNDPPALKGHDKKEGTGEAWDLGRYSGRGHGGRGSGWLFEQQVEYDSEHKVTSGRAIMAATPPFQSSIRFSVDGASGTSVSGFRCTDATKTSGVRTVLHRSGRRKPFMGTANWPGSRRPADPASVTNCLFYRPSWALSVRKSCHRSIRSTCRQWRKLRGHDRRRPRPIGASDEPIRAARSG